MSPLNRSNMRNLVFNIFILGITFSPLIFYMFQNFYLSEGSLMPRDEDFTGGNDNVIEDLNSPPEEDIIFKSHRADLKA